MEEDSELGGVGDLIDGFMDSWVEAIECDRAGELDRT